MNDRLIKLMGLFDFFYRVIILNTLFLVTNAFFFQVYFLFDFKVVFFPIYLLTSLTLLPSILALLRTAHTLKGENSSGIFGIYLRELRFTLRKEMHLSALLTLAFYLGLTTLYVSAVTGPITYLLYAMNIVLIVFEISFGINLAREAISFKGQNLLKQALATYLSNFLKNAAVLMMIALGVFVSFKLSYMAIILVFGAAIMCLHGLFHNSRKDLTKYGVPNQP